MKSGRGESGMVSHVISCLEIHPVNAKHPNVKIVKYNCVKYAQVCYCEICASYCCVAR